MIERSHNHHQYMHDPNHTGQHEQPKKKSKRREALWTKRFKESVDGLLGITTPAEDFKKKAEHYARRKLVMAKEREPKTQPITTTTT